MPFDQDGIWQDPDDPYKYADWTNPDTGESHTYTPPASNIDPSGYVPSSGPGAAGQPGVYFPSDPGAAITGGLDQSGIPYQTGSTAGKGDPTATGGTTTTAPGGITGLSPWTGTFNPLGLGDFTLPDLPAFRAPTLPTITPFQEPDAFKAPDANQVYADPSYNFRKQAGEDALINDAAANGLRRSGGSLKDLINYNSNFASTEYKNIYDRSASEYDRRYAQLVDAFNLDSKTKFDTYDRELSAAGIGYGGELEQYRTQAAAAQAKATLQAQNAYNQYNSNFAAWQANNDLVEWTYDYEKGLV